MQARWGSHGDRAAIVLTAASVPDVYEVTVAAFNLSETYRLPVILLLDASLAHMRENVELPDVTVVDRRKPAVLEGFRPFAGTEFLGFGEGPPLVVTGLAHADTGRPRASDGPNLDRMLRRANDRLTAGAAEVIRTRSRALEDADVAILAYGITARAAAGAVDLLRAEGVRAGLLELQTLWPFPERLVAELAGQIEGLVVPELNLGQLVMPVRAAVNGATPVHHLGRADGSLFTPEEIGQAVHRAMDAVHA
jgi:2-oxoglutarate ferredoxin oxidoreductase subunit alpha